MMFYFEYTSLFCDSEVDQKSTKRVAGFVTALLAVLSSIAGAAADGSFPTKTSQVPPRACTSNWYQVWYLGLHGAAGGYSASRTDEDAQLAIVPSTYTRTQSGIFGGGGQAGYNWTTCNGLFGIEVDGSAGSIRACCRALPTPTYRSPAGSMDWLPRAPARAS
jgi:hypothetical protein